jgi:Putative prokaryotic signal transducing protein
MQQVYAPANAAEAHMLQHLLEQRGIQAHIHGEALLGGVSELPAGGLLQLLVADEHYDEARQFILKWEKANAPARGDAAKVPRMPLAVSLIIFALGLFAGWGLKLASENNLVPIDASVVRFDWNDDGAPDYSYYSRIGATYAYKSEEDANHDGQVDRIVFYDPAGAAERGESDDNFDGFFESRWLYRYGIPSRQEFDTDKNGAADIIAYHRHGVFDREEIFDPATGQVARVNYYDNHLMYQSEIDVNRDGFLETLRTFDRYGEITTTETRAPR